MSFESAKCPNCGGAIQVPNERETANCMYCGSSLKVKDAIEKLRIELSGNVGVAGISSVENDLQRGNQCLAVSDWKNAFNVFSVAVNKQANNYDAWYGCLKAVTHGFTMLDVSLAGENGVMSIESIIHNAIKYGEISQRQQINSNINSLLINLQNSMEKGADFLKKKAHKGRRIGAWIFWGLAAFYIFCGVGYLFGNELDGLLAMIIAAIVFFFIGLIFYIPMKQDRFIYKTREYFDIQRINNMPDISNNRPKEK